MYAQMSGDMCTLTMPVTSSSARIATTLEEAAICCNLKCDRCVYILTDYRRWCYWSSDDDFRQKEGIAGFR